MTDVDMRTDRRRSETAAYWYDETTDERDRARAVLEALRTYRAAETAMRRRTRDSMSMGENELLTLRFLFRQPDQTTRPGALARYLGVSPASVTTMLDKLEKSGHVQRTVDPQDRRNVFVRATERADEEVRHTLTKMHDRMYAVAARMTPEAQAHAAEFLHAMADAVDEVEPADG